MSFFIMRMPEDGLRSSPPVSKHTPLPTRVSFGARSSPQARSMSRAPACWPADRVDRRIILVEEPVADDDAAARAQARSHVLRRPASSAGHILGRRVDEIAGEGDRPGDGLDPGAVGATRPFEHSRAALAPLIAGEGVGAERPASAIRVSDSRPLAPSSA